MVRVLPGVEIKVVKEIIPPPAYPSGVVSLIGTAEKGPLGSPTHLGSWKEFTETFGSSTDHTLTQEAKGAFQNGVFEVVATRVMGKGGENASLTLKDAGKADTAALKASSIGEAGNKIEVKVEKGTEESTVRLLVSDGETFEVFDNLLMNKKSDRYLASYVNQNSTLVTADDLKSSSAFPKNNPASAQGTLKGGKDPGPPSKEDFEAALEALEAEPNVDMVMACNVSDPAVHALVEAHCANMSTEAMGRIGIGTVAEGED
ncbi:MAG: phage tail sheath protein, partial [Candidatus Bathyarchaeota archaeon]|nr:phage tail sheath protein [Candidatus Bathyarchaeota archaeon]